MKTEMEASVASPDLSIIIVNWNSKDFLEGCLKSIRDHVPAEEAQVIVVDNASSDGSADMVRQRFPEYKMIDSGGNIGFGKANNLALRLCDTPHVLFLNPDTVVLPGAISKMIAFMNQNADVGAVGCRMVFEDGEPLPLPFQWLRTPVTELFVLFFGSFGFLTRLKGIFPYQDPDKSGYVMKLYGGCLMVRKDVLDRVGYFDERFFMYCEDVELCQRIYRGGWKIYYMSDAEIIHHCGGSSRATEGEFSTLMKCESISLMIGKYYGKAGAIFYRGSVLIASSAKIAIVLMARLLMIPIFWKKIDMEKYSFKKYLNMLDWSLKIKEPRISG